MCVCVGNTLIFLGADNLRKTKENLIKIMGKEEHANAEVTKSKIGTQQNLKEIVDDELTRVGSGGPWVW